MRKGVSPLAIVYIVLAMFLLGTFGYTQSRGLRIFNIFSGSLSSHTGADGPEHK